MSLADLSVFYLITFRGSLDQKEISFKTQTTSHIQRKEQQKLQTISLVLTLYGISVITDVRNMLFKSENAYDFKSIVPINPYAMGIFKDTAEVNSCLTRASTLLH